MDKSLRQNLPPNGEERAHFVALHNVLAALLQKMDVRAYRLLAPFSTALLEPVRAFVAEGSLKREEAVGLLIGAALTLLWEPRMGQSGWEKSATLELAQEMVGPPGPPQVVEKKKGKGNGKKI